MAIFPNRCSVIRQKTRPSKIRSFKSGPDRQTGRFKRRLFFRELAGVFIGKGRGRVSVGERARRARFGNSTNHGFHNYYTKCYGFTNAMSIHASGIRPTVRPGHAGVHPCQHEAPVPLAKNPVGALRSGHRQERTRVSLGDVVPGKERVRRPGGIGPDGPPRVRNDFLISSESYA